MQPVMRLVLPIIGLLIAASLGSPASRIFDLVLGAAVGFLIADLRILRVRLDTLGKEFERLKKEFRRRQDVPTAPAPAQHTLELPKSPANFCEDAPLALVGVSILPRGLGTKEDQDDPADNRQEVQELPPPAPVNVV